MPSRAASSAKSNIHPGPQFGPVVLRARRSLPCCPFRAGFASRSIPISKQGLVCSHTIGRHTSEPPLPLLITPCGQPLPRAALVRGAPSAVLVVALPLARSPFFSLEFIDAGAQNHAGDPVCRGLAALSQANPANVVAHLTASFAGSVLVVWHSALFFLLLEYQLRIQSTLPFFWLLNCPVSEFLHLDRPARQHWKGAVAEGFDRRSTCSAFSNGGHTATASTSGRRADRPPATPGLQRACGSSSLDKPAGLYAQPTQPRIPVWISAHDPTVRRATASLLISA